MGKTNRNYRTILSASALCLASVWLPLTWCAKKTGQEAAPETSDTLSAIADTLPETPVPFTDTRDGRKYRVVKIGNQRWMAQNLNYQTADSSWCYGNDNSNCDTYGRLYAWSAAKTACPAGWHLPSRAEWDILSNFVNKGGARQVNWTSGSDTAYYWTQAGKNLKSKTGWLAYNGIVNEDEFGFSALPGGYRGFYDGSFIYAGDGGYWWTATGYGGGFPYYRYMSYGNGNVDEGNFGRRSGLSVRCLGDSAWLPLSGSAKTTGQEAAPEIYDTLPQTPVPLSVAYVPFTDTRDGRKYRAVKIGNQRWMAQNLNYDTGDTVGSWCYGDVPANCVKYGRLYDWAAAMGISRDYSSAIWNGSDVNHRGICPDGWHLPSRAEWDSLARNAGGTKVYSNESGNRHWVKAGEYLKSKTGWNSYSSDGVTYSGNGTDDYGFSALPGGLRYYGDGGFGHSGRIGLWWTATGGRRGGAYYWTMESPNHYVLGYSKDGRNGLSVRCLGD